MAKNRGRDVSISRPSLPLNPIRPVAINPLGVTYPSPPIVYSNPTRSYQPIRLTPDITPLATPPNRVAKHATGNNLYTAPAVTKEVSICKNRNIRKQVLFATGNGGKNGMKISRHTPNSKVTCK